MKKLPWKYSFESIAECHNRVDMFRNLLSLRKWFNSCLWAIAQPSIQNAWVRDVRKYTMKAEMQKIVDRVETTWCEQAKRLEENLHGGSESERYRYPDGAYGLLRKDWITRIAIVRSIINDW
jgi:hypothetical protein